jgi:SAM-dependent methyltransferase
LTEESRQSGQSTRSGRDAQEKQDAWTSLGVRTDIPHPARVYDYMLGGKDNFAADREMAVRGLQLVPEMLDSSRGNREFLVRAVAFARDAGIRQFLDIGTGLPISPNTHEIARQGHPDARVVYVDNDPVVFMRAEALMADDATTAVVRADLRDVDEVLARAGQLLDLTQPVALMFVAVLHCIEDCDDAVAIAARYLAALAPGSYLVLSHFADEFAPERMHQASAEAARRGATWVPRGKDDILRMFNGLELIEPGLVLVSYWRPHGGVVAPNADRVWSYGGIARL